MERKGGGRNLAKGGRRKSSTSSFPEKKVVDGKKVASLLPRKKNGKKPGKGKGRKRDEAGNGGKKGSICNRGGLTEKKKP